MVRGNFFIETPHVPVKANTDGVEYALRRFSAVSLAILFSRFFGEASCKQELDQKQSQRIVDLARIHPTVKRLWEAMQKVQPFDGYAICNKDTGEIADNLYGLCIYETEQDALEVVAKTNEAYEKGRKGNATSAFKEFAEIRKVRVTVENGVEFVR